MKNAYEIFSAKGEPLVGEIADIDSALRIDRDRYIYFAPHIRDFSREPIHDFICEFKRHVKGRCFIGCIQFLNSKLPVLIKDFLSRERSVILNATKYQRWSIFYSLGTFYRYVYLCDDAEFFICFSEFLNHFTFTDKYCFKEYTINNIFKNPYDISISLVGSPTFRFLYRPYDPDFFRGTVGTDGLTYIVVNSLDIRILEYLLRNYHYGQLRMNSVICYAILFDRYRHLELLLDYYNSRYHVVEPQIRFIYDASSVYFPHTKSHKVLGDFLNGSYNKERYRRTGYIEKYSTHFSYPERNEFLTNMVNITARSLDMTS